MKKDSTLKIIIFSVTALIVLWLISSVLFPTGYGVSVSYNMPGVTSYGYNSNYGITGLLNFIIQVLLVVFIMSLILGAVSLIKNNLLKSGDDEVSKYTTYKSDQGSNETTNVNFSSEIVEIQSGVESPEIEITTTEEITLVKGETNEEAETENSISEQPDKVMDETNQTVKEKNTCPECGQELDPEWKICLNCGKELKKSRKRRNKNTKE